MYCNVLITERLDSLVFLGHALFYCTTQLTATSTIVADKRWAAQRRRMNG